MNQEIDFLAIHHLKISSEADKTILLKIVIMCKQPFYLEMYEHAVSSKDNDYMESVSGRNISKLLQKQGQMYGVKRLFR